MCAPNAKGESVLQTTMATWASDSPKLSYSYNPQSQVHSGIRVSAPSSLVERLGCKWLFCPHFDPKYAEHLQQNSDGRGSPSKSTGRYTAWYARHISDDLRLKFLAPLSTQQVDRITAPLKELLCDHSLQNLTVDSLQVNPSHESFDPLRESLENSPLARGSAVGGEVELQLAVFPVFRSIVNIVSTLFARKHINAPTVGPLDACHTFSSRINVSPKLDTTENVYLLRTSSKPQTNSDFYVYLNFDRDQNNVYDDKETAYILQDSLLRPGNIVTFAVKFETELDFEVPSSKTAYPNTMCQDLHASSKDYDDKYCAYDPKVLPKCGPDMDDFRADRLKALDDILGTDQSQEEHPVANSLTIQSIEQVNP